MRLLPGVRGLGAFVAACLVATLAPYVALANAPGAPHLWSQDAPFTRNQSVSIDFIQPTGDAIETYLLNNDSGELDDTTSQIAGATTVSSHVQWTLPDSDGPHTVYGQVKYTSFGWTAPFHLDFNLDRDTVGALYVDFDVVNAGGQDGHALSSSSAATFTAWKTPVDQSPATGFQVSDGTWIVGFYNGATDFSPGPYTIGPTISATIMHAPLHTTCTVTGGSFTINQVALYNQEQDVDTADVDFRLLCGTNVMAGSVRYGSADAITALDQDVNSLSFGQAHIGVPAATQTATVTNLGSSATTLGNAAISGTDSADFSLGSDSCSGASLGSATSLLPADHCQMGVVFTPSARGVRTAVLTLPDGTARGARTFRLSGTGDQPTTTVIEIPNLTDTGQQTLDVLVTITPPAPGSPTLKVDDSQKFGPDKQTLAEPARDVYTFHNITLTPGNRSVTASYGGQDYYLASTADPWNFTIGNNGDTTPPVGNIVIVSTQAQTGYTNDPYLVIQYPATDDKSAVAEVGIRWTTPTDTSGWIYVPYTADLDSKMLQTDVPTTLEVKWRDTMGNWSDVQSAVITVDQTAPTVDQPTQVLVAGTTVSGGKVSVNVPWSGDDALSGIADYTLNEKVDAKAWKDVPVAAPTVNALQDNASVDLALTPGHAYTFRVKADDNATNACNWVVGPRLSLKTYQEANWAVTYKGKWIKKTGQSFWGGATKASVKSGATASVTFTGRSFGWVTMYGPDRGKAEVYVNGVLAATVDLYSPTATSKVVAWAGSWDTASARTVTIKVLGTSGRPRVDLDAFLIIK
ncbi:MAG: choice-of-anchor D domain-containing protein [Chloroflexota bacterium]